MCVCVSSLVVFWQEKGHKVLHELKISFLRTLSNLEKFWFSRKVRTWGAPLSKIWVGVGTTVMGKLHSQAPQGFVLQGQIFHCHDKSSTVCSQRSFSTHSAQVASSPMEPSTPSPGNSLESTRTCGAELHQWQPAPFQRTVHGEGEATPYDCLRQNHLRVFVSSSESFSSVNKCNHLLI